MCYFIHPMNFISITLLHCHCRRLELHRNRVPQKSMHRISAPIGEATAAQMQSAQPPATLFARPRFSKPGENFRRDCQSPVGGRTDIRIPCLNHHCMRAVCECSSARRRSKGYIHPLYKTSVPDRHMLKTFPSVFAHFTEMRTSLRTSASGPDKGERALSVGVSVNQARTHTCVTVDRLCCLRCTCINISWHAINPPRKG